MTNIPIISQPASIMDTYQRIAELSKELVAAQKKVERESASRMALPPGSTRARVTTANGRWMAICEHRDRLDEELRAYLKDTWFSF